MPLRNLNKSCYFSTCGAYLSRCKRTAHCKVLTKIYMELYSSFNRCFHHYRRHHQGCFVYCKYCVSEIKISIMLPNLMPNEMPPKNFNKSCYLWTYTKKTPLCELATSPTLQDGVFKIKTRRFVRGPPSLTVLQNAVFFKLCETYNHSYITIMIWLNFRSVSIINRSCKNYF